MPKNAAASAEFIGCTNLPGFFLDYAGRGFQRYDSGCCRKVSKPLAAKFSWRALPTRAFMTRGTKPSTEPKDGLANGYCFWARTICWPRTTYWKKRNCTFLHARRASSIVAGLLACSRKTWTRIKFFLWTWGRPSNIVIKK